MLQSVLHKIQPLPALLDLGQMSHMGDPQAIRKAAARACGTLQPPEANSKIDSVCPSFLLNQRRNCNCSGATTGERRRSRIKEVAFYNSCWWLTMSQGSVFCKYCLILLPKTPARHAKEIPDGKPGTQRCE